MGALQKPYFEGWVILLPCLLFQSLGQEWCEWWSYIFFLWGGGKEDKEIPTKASKTFNIIKVSNTPWKISEASLSSGLKKKKMLRFLLQTVRTQIAFKGGCNKNMNIIISDKM